MLHFVKLSILKKAGYKWIVFLNYEISLKRICRICSSTIPSIDSFRLSHSICVISLLNTLFFQRDMKYIGNYSIKERISFFLPFSLIPFSMDYEGAMHISYYRLLQKLIRISSLTTILLRASFEKWLSLIKERIPERGTIPMRMFLFYHLAYCLQHRLHFYPQSALFLLTENA
jgi:hypothetical protein